MRYNREDIMQMIFSFFRLLKTFIYSQLHHSRSFISLIAFIIIINVVYIPNSWNMVWHYLYTFVLFLCFSYILVQYDFENASNTSTYGNHFKLFTQSIVFAISLILLMYFIFYVFLNTSLWDNSLLLYGLLAGSLYLLYKIRYIPEEDNKHSFMFAKLLTEPFLLIYNIGYICYCHLKKYIIKLSNIEERNELLRNIIKWFSRYRNSLVIIFFCLLFLICEFFPLTHWNILSSNTILLLKEPTYLNKMHTIGKVDILHKNQYDRNYTFSIQCWIYIDQNSPSHNVASNMDTTLLDYGHVPLITYNVKTRKLIVFIKQGENELVKIYETSTLKLQKWNYFVFNYNHGIIDVFINASLVASENNIVPVMKQDEIICGSENGLMGGIKNVYYSKNVVKSLEMNVTYMSHNLFQTSYFLPNNI